MTELTAKLARLTDSDRVALYRELLERLGEPSRQVVKELVLVCEDTEEIDPDAIKAFANKHLPEHERPTRVVPVTKLPRTSHGKLDRRALPALIRPALKHNEQPVSEASDPSAEFSDQNLASVIETFNQVLETSSIEPDSNFFELGGHSLLAVECILALEERTGKRISITQFLNHPTARGIAEQLSEQSRQTYNYVYPVSENLSGLPVFVFSASRLSYALKKHRTDWTIYGIQLRWRDENGEEIQYRDIEHMASCIATEIKQLSANRDFVLAGSSFPGILAFEVARQLKGSGAESLLTMLVEPTFIYSGLRGWIENDLAQAGNLRAGENPYITWSRINHPFRASFWQRINRRRARNRSIGVQRDNRIKGKADFAAYERARTTTLWRSYRPGQYDGPALLLTSSRTSLLYCRDWINLLTGNDVIHYADLDTDHFAILTEPFMSDVVVPLLTSKVDTRLREDGCSGVDSNPSRRHGRRV